MQERLDEVQEEIDEAVADAERAFPDEPKETFVAGERRDPPGPPADKRG